MQPTENIYSMEGEAAVLGSMILDGRCIDTAIAILPPDAFFTPENQTIYDALVDARTGGAEIDMVLLRDHLKKSGKLQEVGGAQYLIRLCESVPTTANLKYYADIVKEKFISRELIQKANDIKEIAESPDDTGTKIDAMQEIVLALNTKPQGIGITHVKEHLPDAYEGLEEAPSIGLSTGYRLLDYQLQGLNAGDLIIPAGRPSMGKTSLALNIAANVAQKGGGVVFYTLEMTKTQLTQRLICSEARVSMQGAKQQILSRDDLDKLTAAGNVIHEWPLFISQQISLTPEKLLASLRTLRRQHQIDLVIVDYLQLMAEPTVKESRNQQITSLSRKLKGIALGEEIPVMVLSQLSRQPEARTNKRPLLSDLRDSGSIEQDADVVLFLYRQAYYNLDADDTTEVIIAKNRNGPTGKIELMFHPEYVSFENKAR